MAKKLFFGMLLSMALFGCANNKPGESNTDKANAEGAESEKTTEVQRGYIDSISSNVEALPAFDYPAGSPVAKWGKLKVGKNSKGFRCMCDEKGNPIQLRGMSTHGLQWAGVANVTKDNIKALRNEWNCNVFRYALYVDEEGGLAYNPQFRNDLLEKVVKWTADNGIYLLIDWHVHRPGDPNAPQYRCHPSNGRDLAGDFFTYCSRRYKNLKHIIYEVCNEPNMIDDHGVEWETEIKPYCEEMLGIIRANDNAIVVCGTPWWSSCPEHVIGKEVADKDGKPYENVMYTFHFYSASHNDGKQFDKDGNLPPTVRPEDFFTKIKGVLGELPIFVTEWGTTEASGWHDFRADLSDKWLDILDGDNAGEQVVSWCNWSFSAEGGVCGALKWNTGKISPMDPEILTESGQYVFKRLHDKKYGKQ
ncbi:MAG: glycoside hydrolase family 5 protein [Paludibacteraceae bacterium]|nr:glycoside hydrolase family 5 protein [Paludibacteraceae bacterium]